MKSDSSKAGQKVEFHRPFDINSLSYKQPHHEVELAAKPAERAALAERFSLPSINVLTAHVNVRLDSGGDLIEVTGTIHADFEQVCVTTAEAFAVTMAEPFSNDFVRASARHKWTRDDEEPEDFDVLDKDIIDLGEVVAQYFYLLLDPFSRKPGVQSDFEEASDTQKPFAKILQFMKKDD